MTEHYKEVIVLELLEILLPLGALLFGSLLYRNTVDKTKGEPLLAEEALVHAKTDHSNRYSSFYTIHFYIAARDTVVTCGVPEQIWHLLKKGQRGILCHQGGTFYSFERNGELLCSETVPPKLTF